MVLHAEKLQRHILHLAYYILYIDPQLKYLLETNSELTLQVSDQKPKMTPTAVPLKTTSKIFSYL